MKLEDAERLAASSPTFELPSREDREALAPGDHVKLVFLADAPCESGRFAGCKAERMWVLVDEKKDGRYVGKLSNTPTFLPLEFEDRVEFGPEHVIAIMKSDA